MDAEFVIARNPQEGSALPYLLRLPLGDGVVLKARDTWARTAKVYCHRADGWPEDPEIVERVPVHACVRRGAAIDLVLDRAREHRSQIVFTIARGREAIFWQTARTARKARPRITTPIAKAGGVSGPLTVVVDTQEKYPYRFTRQQVTVTRRRLPAGDYAVEPADGLVAAVERKSLPDLLTALSTGTLGYALADLTTLARAAVVVEDRYARLLAGEHVRPAVAADALAEAQVRWPAVPIVFCDTRPWPRSGPIGGWPQPTPNSPRPPPPPTWRPPSRRQARSCRPSRPPRNPRLGRSPRPRRRRPRADPLQPPTGLRRAASAATLIARRRSRRCPCVRPSSPTAYEQRMPFRTARGASPERGGSGGRGNVTGR